MENDNLIRLNKYISESGICSRREADKFIENGKVYINGTLALVGTKVTPTDTVVVNGNTIKPKSNKVYIALLISLLELHVQQKPMLKETLLTLLTTLKEYFLLGVLISLQKGLIFLTNDGNMVNKILRAGNNHEKEYIVSVDKPIDKELLTLWKVVFLS